MKKIPTLFERVYENHKVVGILPNITPGCEEAFLKGKATVKLDGSCCAVIDGKFYKRYDAKKGKKAPEGAIPCCEPDPVTSHHPHWVAVDENNPADKWFVKAYENHKAFYAAVGGLNGIPDGTYEAVGAHFQGNPYKYQADGLFKHGVEGISDLNRDFLSVKQYLKENEIEGIVFWLDDEPVCKIKRTDFGFSWPVKEGE